MIYICIIYREDINREDFFFSSLRRMIDNRLHIYGRRVNFDIWYIRFPENRLTTFSFLFFFAIVIISTFAPRFDKYRGRKSRGEKKYCSNFKLVDFGTKTKATMGWKKIYLVASIFFQFDVQLELTRCRGAAFRLEQSYCARARADSCQAVLSGATFCLLEYFIVI